jgi:tRNA pseudouridine38-40 synthase
VSLRRFRVELEYDGTDFSGWQVQPGVRTVQGEVERALGLLSHQEIRVHAAGRTDAGVHALGQVISLEMACSIGGDQLALGLNRYLPPDVRAVRSEEVAEEFHARYSAEAKRYGYTAVIHRGARPLLSRFAGAYWPGPDVDKMKLAAQAFVGEHEFAAFAASGRQPGPTRRRVTEVRVWEAESMELPGPLTWGGSGEDEPRAVKFVVAGEGFLYKMVRNMVGTLMEVGLGKRDVESISKALATGDREDCGKTAPACGLVLVGVDYGDAYPWQDPRRGD